MAGFAATVTRAQWIRLGLLFLAAAVLCMGNWRWQMHREQARFERSLVDLRSWDRTQLGENWHDWDDLPAARWEPSASADTALAIIPRRGRMKKDAIYLLYQGQKVTALVAVTRIGTWVQGDRKDLDQIAGLLKAREAKLKPGSEKELTNREAISLAEKQG